MSEHAFYDPLGHQPVTLIIGDDFDSTGVRHEGCDQLAHVSPEIDCAFCIACHWQCRMSGQWFMDLWAARSSGPS